MFRLCFVCVSFVFRLCFGPAFLCFGPAFLCFGRVILCFGRVFCVSSVFRLCFVCVPSVSRGPIGHIFWNYGQKSAPKTSLELKIGVLNVERGDECINFTQKAFEKKILDMKTEKFKQKCRPKCAKTATTLLQESVWN